MIYIENGRPDEFCKKNFSGISNMRDSTTVKSNVSSKNFLFLKSDKEFLKAYHILAVNFDEGCTQYIIIL